MTFWEACYADAKSPWIRVGAGFIEFPDEANEVCGMAESALGPIIARLIFGWVAAQREDIADSGGSITSENVGDLLLGMADAGEMRHRRD